MTVTWPPRGKDLGGLVAKAYIDEVRDSLAQQIANITTGSGDMRNQDNLAFLADFAVARAFLDTLSSTEIYTAITTAVDAIVVGTGAVTSVNTQTGDVVLDNADVGADIFGAAAQALLDAKAYADAIASGNSPRAACRVATAAALPACTYANGTAGVGATLTATGNGALTVDTVAVSASDPDRVLVKDQASAFQNGIYDVTVAGSGGTPWILTRATDADASSEVPAGMVTFIAGGTTPRLAGTFVQLTADPLVIGTDPQVFDQSGATSSYTFSNGLVLAAGNVTPTYGTTAGTIAQGNDARFTDARTPLAHKVSHQAGGTDELLLTEAQVTNLTADLAGKLAASGNLAALASASTARTNLGLGGAAVLNVGTTTGTVAAGDDSRFGGATDPEIAAIAGLTSAADKLPYFTGSGTAALADFTTVGRALVDDSTVAAQRTTLGLVIGTDVQAFDADLAAIASLTATTDNIIQSVGSAWASRTPAQLKTSMVFVKADVGLGNVDNTADAAKTFNASAITAGTMATARLGSGTASSSTFLRGDQTWQTVSAGGGDLLAANNLSELTATQSTVRSNLGLVIGTNVQAFDADLTTIASLTATTDNILQSVAGAWASRTPAQVKTTLGLTVGTNVQAWDADLDTLASLTATTDNMIQSVGSAWASRTPAQVKTTLGLTVGTNVQAWDADLDAIAGLTSAADRLPYFTGSGAASLATFTAAGRALVDDADATAQRATLGLVIGTNVQAFDTELTAIAGLTSAADKVPYFTGSGTAAVADFTALARARMKANRSTFSDANYTVLATDAHAAQTGTLTAPRTITLPAASAFVAGQRVLISDESGTPTKVNKITINRAGSDTILDEVNLANTTSLEIRGAYEKFELVSDGTSKWHVVENGAQRPALYWQHGNRLAVPDDVWMPIPWNAAIDDSNHFSPGFDAFTTTIAAASDALTLPTATITVASTTGFPAAGYLVITGPPYLVTSIASDVTADTFTTDVTHSFTQGESVKISGLSATTGLTNLTTYFVRDVTATTFKLAATFGGAAINLTGSADASINVWTMKTDTVVGYTGTTGTTFTGCNTANNTLFVPHTNISTGTLKTGMVVTGANCRFGFGATPFIYNGVASVEYAAHDTGVRDLRWRSGANVAGLPFVPGITDSRPATGSIQNISSAMQPAAQSGDPTSGFNFVEAHQTSGGVLNVLVDGIQSPLLMVCYGSGR